MPPALAPRDDIDQDAQLEAGFGLDFLEQCTVNALTAARRGQSGMERAAGTGEPPDFLGDAVHVHRQTDPAIADQGKAEFLLAHYGLSIIAAPIPPRSADGPTRAARLRSHARRTRSRESRA